MCVCPLSYANRHSEICLLAICHITEFQKLTFEPDVTSGSDGKDEQKLENKWHDIFFLRHRQFWQYKCLSLECFISDQPRDIVKVVWA